MFPIPAGSGQSLRVNLFAPPLDRSQRLHVALACGLAALVAGALLMLWTAGRWLAAPLRRLSEQDDAIAGGEPIETRTTSPIREVGNVGTAVAGMAAMLAQTAEQDARAEAERRLLVSFIAHDLRTPLFALRGYTADQRGVELRVAGRTGSAVTIDRDGFERAVANVLDNALRHTPQGGTIDVTYGEDTEGAFVHVVNDGTGIAADLLPHIFEPMVRANHNGLSGGTGLGLMIAARLLGNQGGAIHAANAPGRGAILTLRLPPTSV